MQVFPKSDIFKKYKNVQFMFGFETYFFSRNGCLVGLLVAKLFKSLTIVELLLVILCLPWYNFIPLLSSPVRPWDVGKRKILLGVRVHWIRSWKMELNFTYYYHSKLVGKRFFCFLIVYLDLLQHMVFFFFFTVVCVFRRGLVISFKPVVF